MADLLTHILAGYTLAVLLSFRYEWITPQYLTIAMLGTTIPDLNNIGLLIPDTFIQGLLGIPFDWSAIHTLGGGLVAIVIGACVASGEHRRRVFVLLLLGMLSHHALDALLLSPSGYSYAIFWPFTTYHPPTPRLYHSTDRLPAMVSIAVATVVWYVRYHSLPAVKAILE